MMNSNFDMFSSGMGNFENQSTADDGNVSPTINVEAIEISERGKYSVFEVANWFLSKESMTHKKMQKLCYYAQAWYFTLKDARLMDTQFEAWVHGPVSPALYDRFKPFGFSSIKLVGNYISHIDGADIEFLDSVWETYGDHTGNALEALSHSEAPWIEARAGYAPSERCNVPISPITMKHYYASIYAGGDA